MFLYYITPGGTKISSISWDLGSLYTYKASILVSALLWAGESWSGQFHVVIQMEINIQKINYHFPSKKNSEGEYSIQKLEDGLDFAHDTQNLLENSWCLL